MIRHSKDLSLEREGFKVREASHSTELTYRVFADSESKSVVGSRVIVSDPTTGEFEVGCVASVKGDSTFHVKWADGTESDEKKSSYTLVTSSPVKEQVVGCRIDTVKDGVIVGRVKTTKRVLQYGWSHNEGLLWASAPSQSIRHASSEWNLVRDAVNHFAVKAIKQAGGLDSIDDVYNQLTGVGEEIRREPATPEMVTQVEQIMTEGVPEPAQNKPDEVDNMTYDPTTKDPSSLRSIVHDLTQEHPHGISSSADKTVEGSGSEDQPIDMSDDDMVAHAQRLASQLQEEVDTDEYAFV